MVIIMMMIVVRTHIVFVVWVWVFFPAWLLYLYKVTIFSPVVVVRTLCTLYRNIEFVQEELSK